MNVAITPTKLCGKINAPPSKSYAHRLIIAACLSGKSVSIKGVGSSKDVIATVSCMKALGADCAFNGNDFIVKSFSPVNTANLDALESGSTLRFILPICAALGVKAKITGSEKLLSRPSLPLIEALNKVGAKITANEKVISIEGKIAGNEITVDGSISSQYVSGLLLAMSYINGESFIKVVGTPVSEKYIDITIDVLNSFGVKVCKSVGGYKIIGGTFSSNKTYFTEGDYSGAAFMLAAAAIGGKITVKGLNASSKQGDLKIVEVLKSFGANVAVSGNEITVRSETLKGISLSCENIPDLAQIISVVAAFSKGETVISGIGRLKYKESDRLKAITDMLDIAGIDNKTDGETLIVYGGEPKGGKFFSNNDHRTAMSAAILAAYAKGNSLICGAEAVNKSYPNFFDDFTLLGGKADVII